MTPVDILLGYKPGSWFTANPTLVLKEGQHAHLSDGSDEYIDAYTIGDGVTELQDLPWKGVKSTLAGTITTDAYTISGTSLNATSTTNVIGYFKEGQKCKIGVDGIIASVVGTLVTFSEDYTGQYFEVVRLI